MWPQPQPGRGPGIFPQRCRRAERQFTARPCGRRSRPWGRPSDPKGLGGGRGGQTLWRTEPQTAQRVVPPQCDFGTQVRVVRLDYGGVGSAGCPCLACHVVGGRGLDSAPPAVACPLVGCPLGVVRHPASSRWSAAAARQPMRRHVAWRPSGDSRRRSCRYIDVLLWGGVLNEVGDTPHPDSAPCRLTRMSLAGGHAPRGRWSGPMGVLPPRHAAHPSRAPTSGPTAGGRGGATLGRRLEAVGPAKPLQSLPSGGLHRHVPLLGPRRHGRLRGSSRAAGQPATAAVAGHIGTAPSPSLLSGKPHTSHCSPLSSLSPSSPSSSPPPPSLSCRTPGPRLHSTTVLA